MKTTQAFLLVLFISTSLFAQKEEKSPKTDNIEKADYTVTADNTVKADYTPKTVSVEEITREMSKGKQPGFKTELYQHDKKTAGEALIHYLKEQKVKTELVNNEYVTTAAMVKSLSTKPISIYYTMLEYESHVELYAFYEINNVFLTKETSETEYLSAKKFTRNLAVYAYKASMQEEVDAEGKKLKQLESELEKIHKEHESLQKKISDEKQSIDNTKEKIATSELDQERVRGQVQDEKGALSTTRAGGNETLIKEEEKKLKGFEGDLSKLQKQEDGYHKDITNSEAAIRDYERDITNNINEATTKQADVDKQKDHVYNLTKKKEAIK